MAGGGEELPALLSWGPRRRAGPHLSLEARRRGVSRAVSGQVVPE